MIRFSFRPARTSRAGRFFQALVFILPVLCFPFFTSCSASGKAPEPLPTWQSRNEGIPEALPVSIEGELPEGAFPVAGTVSHHQITWSYLVDWFSELAKRRKVKTFLILSPRHFDQGYQKFSLTELPYKAGNNIVRVDTHLERELARRLKVKYDDIAFPIEHGVSTLIPYIARYFPEAKIAPVLADWFEPGLTEEKRALEKAILPLIDKKRDDVFLLVSVDFSHHHNEEITERNDARSRLFFERPTRMTAGLANADNRRALYLLGALSEDQGLSAVIRTHTNALRIYPHETDPEDITSYFFSFFYLPQKN